MISFVLEWGSDNPTFRQVFTSRFIPGGTDEQIGWFNELCRKTLTPEIAARLLESRAMIDVTTLLGKVRAPTLVLHARGDAVVPIAEGHILAAGIPGAQFIELDSKNHILLENEPAWERFCDEVLEFMGLKGSTRGEDPAFASLSPREREVLALMAEGSVTHRSRSVCRSAKRLSAITSRIFSTSSACGRAPKPSSSPSTAVSRVERN